VTAKNIPQGLKPSEFADTLGTAEAVPLQSSAFSASCEAVLLQSSAFFRKL
jgi:hypothetical protein